MTHTHEPFAFRCRVWNFDRGALVTPPYADEPPPMMFLAGCGDETLELVGKYADGWNEVAPGSFDADPAVFARKVMTIREHATSVGRDPDRTRILLWLSVLMMDDSEMLERAVEHPTTKWRTLLASPAPVWQRLGLVHPYGGTWNYMKDVVPEWYTRDEFYDVVNRVPNEAVRTVNFFGSSDEVIEQVQPWLDMGVTDVMIYNLGTLCGSEYLEACTKANAKLRATLEGRRVNRENLDGY